MRGGGAVAPGADQILAVFRHLAERAHDTAVRNGHYRGGVTPTETLSRFVEYVGVLHNYVRRSRGMGLSRTTTGKPIGFPALLADVLVLSLSVARHWNVDIGSALLEKMAYNDRLAKRST